MKVGDLVRLAQENVGYNAHLFDEIMLVTEIIDELVLPDDIGVAIVGMAACISESGENRFPMEDLEVI